MADINNSLLIGQDYLNFKDTLSLGEKEELERVETRTQFEEFCKTRGIENSSFLWEARMDHELSQMTPPGSEEEAKPEGNKSEYGRRRRRIEYREPTYEEFQESSREEAEKKASEWENNPDTEVATSRQQAYDIALTKTHNDFVKNRGHLADKWAKEHNDLFLASALERKRLADEERRNNSKIRKKYYESGLEEKVSKAKTKLKKITDIPARTKDYLAQTRIGKIFSRANQKIRYVFGAPGRQYGKFKKWLSQTRIGKAYTKISGAPGRLKNRIKSRVLNSRLGRFGSKLNRIGKKIKNLLNPLDYLLRLFKRTFISGLAGIIGSFISSAIGLAGTLATALLAGAASTATFAAIAVSKILAGISTTIAAILAPFSPLVVFGIFAAALIIAIAAVLFGPAAPGRSKQYSPYPGIVYSINSEYPKIPNGQNIKYKIIVLYDPSEAKYSLDKLLLVDTLPAGTSLVRSGTTGKFDSTSRPGTVIWKLSKNTPTKDTEDGISYDFDLTLKPQDDLTVENKIKIETGDLPDNPGGGDLTGLYEGADSRPTNNDCGKYDGKDGVMTKIQNKWPELRDKTNYGDPVCSYTDAKFDKVIELTETKHPENIPFWKDISYSEGVSPNSTDVPGKAEEMGTWGRLQMRRSFPLPGKTWDPEKNDRGDVPWQKQIENAISKNNSDTNNGRAFDYWGTARCLCYFDYYRKNDAWCGYIKTIPNIFVERRPYAYGGLCSIKTDSKGKEHGWVPDSSKVVR